MTPQEALSVLDQATDPAKAGGRLTRSDYVMIDQALAVLGDLVGKHAPTPAVPEAAEKP